MSQQYNIRRATSTDLDYIIDCRRRMFTEMGDTAYLNAAHMNQRYRAWITPRLAQELHVGWILETEAQPVANAGLELLEQQPHPATLRNLRGHVVNVYVEPAHRRQGLARHLMTTLLDWCDQQQITLITLNASDAARPLYESLGFTASNDMVYQRRTRS